ncbi:Non-SMC condensin II complex, subunit H2-like protein, partial [Cynara cardunculus var. scolymus]
MNSNDKVASTSDAGGSKFHTVQPLRDLESNWEVDLANNLEEYLLKICSGEIIGGEDDGQLSVNFAEAALLLQGSIQVYSRKVEYLYSLVLHALKFISQQSQKHDQPENSSSQEEQNGSVAAPAESDDSFWCSDDIPVDAKNSLDSSHESDTLLNCFVKPPANLVVLEGDCLDASGDSGELDSYLLATNDLYRDFILLDASDAVAVNEYLGGSETVSQTKNDFKGGSSLASKSRKSFISPSKRSGHKLSAGKSNVPDQNQSACADQDFKTNDHNIQSEAPECNVNMDNECDMDDGFSQPGEFDDSDEDDDDPWKPLNPHEQGNLKIKPFKKVKAYKRDWPNPATKVSITEEFPLAKLHGPISAELYEIWEARRNVYGKDKEPQSPPYYEKLRQSLVLGDHGNTGPFNGNQEDEDGGYDFVADDFDMPKDAYMDEDHFNHEKHIDDTTKFDSKEPFEYEDPDAHVNLEDLCRSHLDSLLAATIAETEKQNAIAARVSNWKQRIEQNLDEQDARPPFDIHKYGRRTLDKLSREADIGNSIPFTDIVSGQEKHDIARTFSALLQLVNNGDVELDKGGCEGEFLCYTGEKPFHVRLVSNATRPEIQLRSSSKRPKSQMKRGKENQGAAVGSSVKVGKVIGIWCTPEGKKRRRSRVVDPDGLKSEC